MCKVQKMLNYYYCYCKMGEQKKYYFNWSCYY